MYNVYAKEVESNTPKDVYFYHFPILRLFTFCSYELGFFGHFKKIQNGKDWLG